MIASKKSLSVRFILAITLTFLVFTFTCNPAWTANESKGVNVEAVEKQGVRIWTAKGCGSRYRLGELLNIRVEAKRSGYLTVFDLMPDGEVQILYPNQYHRDNYIQARKVHNVPAPADDFQLRISKPRGFEQLLAVVTEDKRKLVREDFSHYAQAFPVLEDSKGKVVEQVKKGINVIPDETWWAGDSCSFSVGRKVQTEETEEEPVSTEAIAPQGEVEGRILIVGIASYSNAEFTHLGRTYKFKELRYSVNDARDMKDLLEEKFTRVKLLLNEEATYENIKRNVKNWLGETKSGEVAGLYFSGHGAFQTDMNGDEKDGYDEVLVPSDYARAEKFIVDDQLSDWFDSLSTEKIVYIADSCHAGTSSKAVRTFTAPTNKKSLHRDLLKDSIGGELTAKAGGTAKGSPGAGDVVALEASKPSQSAREDKDLEQGVFTHFLLKGMKGDADKDGNGKITPEEVYSFSKQGVMEYTDNRQEPVCSGCDRADIYLSLVR